MLFICHRVAHRLPKLGLPAEYCYSIRRLQNLIDKNKSYKIIIICKAEHVSQLYGIITQRVVQNIYILGQCKDSRIQHKIASTKDNERDLIFDIIIETIRHTRHIECRKHRQRNPDSAEASASDVLNKLLDSLQAKIRNEI